MSIVRLIKRVRDRRRTDLAIKEYKEVCMRANIKYFQDAAIARHNYVRAKTSAVGEGKEKLLQLYDEDMQKIDGAYKEAIDQATKVLKEALAPEVMRANEE